MVHGGNHFLGLGESLLFLIINGAETAPSCWVYWKDIKFSSLLRKVGKAQFKGRKLEHFFFTHRNAESFLKSISVRKW